MTAAEELLAWLEENRNEKNIEGMARFGIRTDRAVGVPLPLLRAAAKPIGAGTRRPWRFGSRECTRPGYWPA